MPCRAIRGGCLIACGGPPSSRATVTMLRSARPTLRRRAWSRAAVVILGAGYGGRRSLRRSIEDLHQCVGDEALEIDETSIMVLKHCGRRGYSGMAEVGNRPVPKKLLKRGVRDMVRISNAHEWHRLRPVVLHVAAEASAGGPLAFAQDGDLITLDVAARSLHLHVDQETLDRRRAAWVPPAPHAERGYAKPYIDRVLQADPSPISTFSSAGPARRCRATITDCISTEHAS